MMINPYIFTVLTLIIAFITNKILNLGFLKGGIVTLIIIVIGYIIYIKNKQTKRYNILNEELDPDKFINATHKAYQYAGKDKQLNSLYNIDLSFAYMSLGDYDKSLKYLKKVDYKKLHRPSYFGIYYFTSLMITYYNLDDKENALAAYNQGLNLGATNEKSENLIELLNANKYLYTGEYNKSKKIFESYLNDKISKRFSLEILYVLAYIDEKQDRIDDAISKYEIVVKDANKLNIRNQAKERLLMLKSN